MRTANSPLVNSNSVTSLALTAVTTCRTASSQAPDVSDNTRRSAFKTTHDQRSVVAAEPERIRQRRVDSLRARDVGYIVEIAVRVGVLVVDRRRQTTLQDRFDADDRFDRDPGPAQRAGHALGRGHG